MNYLSRLLSLFILVTIVFLSVSCDDESGSKSEEESQLEKLRGTWNIQSVDNDGQDRLDEYPNMTLAISGTYTEGGTYNYTSDADTWPSVSPWKAIDTWKFKAGSVGNTITRQIDLKDMSYELSESDTKLTIEFNYTGVGFNNARTASVTGDWVFVFTK